MSKKLKIEIAILIILIIGAGVYFFFLRGGVESGSGAIEAFDDLFSFNSLGGSEDVGLTEDEDIDNNISDENIFNENQENGNFSFGGITPELKKITSKEVSGYGIFDISTTTTVIRYIDTESGNVFEADLKTSTANRVTNTTILQTVDSFWLDRDSVVLRYIDENKDIQSFSAKIISTDSEETGESVGELSGSFLEKDIEEIDTISNKIFALIEDSFGSRGIVYSPDLKSENTVLSTPLKEVLVSWVDKNTIAINTKPSNNSLGYLFLLDVLNESFNPYLSEIKGLSSVVSENKDVVYSQSENRGVSLWYLNNLDGEVKKIDKSTFAEKCVWDNLSKNIIYCAVPKNINFRNLPDDWYKGNVSFSDNIWKFDLETGEMEMIVVPEDLTGENIDVINISISENSKYIVFVNKKDKTLWVVSL